MAAGRVQAAHDAAASSRSSAARRRRFARWVTAGIALSVVGDIALLADSNRAFMVGLVAFLLAHVAYVIAFLGVAAWSPHVAIVAVVIGRGIAAAAARHLEGRGRAARPDDRVRGRHQRDGRIRLGDGRRAAR